MGIIIDAILIIILLVSSFLGYKKGLVKLGAKLFAGIIAIILTIIIYKPVSGIIINNTQLDEKIESAIIENTTKFIDEKTDNPNTITNNIENQILPEQAESIARGAVYAIIGVILFVVVKIILNIVISLFGVVAELPILKQFNEVGGALYGILRGILIIGILVLIMGVVTKVNPENSLNEKIENSHITKFLYENIVKF